MTKIVYRAYMYCNIKQDQANLALPSIAKQNQYSLWYMYS